MIACHTRAGGRVPELVHAALADAAGHLRPRRIVLKPNWVMHETEPEFPIAALVTDAGVIDAAVRACVRLFPGAERITVGDCPEQRSDWPLMCRQSGLTPVIERLAVEHPQVEFRDLRKAVYKSIDGELVLDAGAANGDPSGYREVQLHGESHFEPIADQADRFSIHDHDTSLTRGGHRPGDHRYLVSQTVLDADLIINLPKWKAHSKSGLTGALKNLVGINGDKSYLPHFRRGSPQWGGDEYSDEGRWLYWAQDNLRQLVRGTVAYDMLRPAWRAVRQVNNAVRRRRRNQSMPSDFYVVGGSWYGNQTVWRMIFDLNLVIQRVDRHGRLQPTPQRDYLCIVDGLVAGEGDGPLKARPRPTDLLVVGDDPFAIDVMLAWLMGFDPDRIPVLSNRHEFLGCGWGRFDLDQLTASVDGESRRVIDCGINFQFAPPPGWVGQIERGGSGRLPRSA